MTHEGEGKQCKKVKRTLRVVELGQLACGFRAVVSSSLALIGQGVGEYLMAWDDEMHHKRGSNNCFPVDVDVISPSDLCHRLGPFPDTGPNLLGWYDVLRGGIDDHGRGFEVESRLHNKANY
jgi:hypothetical protein